MDIIDHIAIKVSNLKEAEDWYLEHFKGSSYISRPQVHPIKGWKYQYSTNR